ncbi:MAG TPA: hypothetical protein VIM27_06695 [Gaiellales bacterium]
MGVYLLHELAQWAGATAVLALLGCLIAAILGVEMSASVFLPGEAAFDLAKAMAILGGSAVLVAASTSTLYFWLVGVASERAAVLVEVSLLGSALVFAGTLRILLDHGRRARAHR